MIDEPLVSVIIPTYNRANYIGRAINSILNQTYTSIQIIVVDDGSTDNTIEKVEQYKHVEYYYKENGGQASARNFGLDFATGKYISTLDSDDMWYPDFLKKSVEKLENQNLDFTFSNWCQECNDGTNFDYLLSSGELRSYYNTQNNEWIYPEYSLLRSLFIKACVAPSSAFVFRRTSIISKWNNEMKIADDWCMLLDIITSKKCKVGFTFEQMWYKAVNQDNIYDGKQKLYTTQILFAEDLGNIILRFQDVLNQKEIKIFQEKRIEKLLKVSYFNFKKPKIENQKIAVKYLINSFKSFFFITDRIDISVLFSITKRIICRINKKLFGKKKSIKSSHIVN